MIMPIASYNTNFNGRAKFAQQPVKKVAKQIVNIEKSSLKGISKTPVRFAEKIDPDTQAAISGIVSSAAALVVSASNLS